jgi:hypothetical protein
MATSDFHVSKSNPTSKAAHVFSGDFIAKRSSLAAYEHSRETVR